MIQETYADGKKHIHVLSYGGGTQSTALLLMALKGEINGVKPDYIIFSDTGWEPKSIYAWVKKVNEYIKKTFNREIIFTNGGNIRTDMLNAANNQARAASLPYFTLSPTGEKGMVMRQCTAEYKIQPVTHKIRNLLSYGPRQKVKEVVHVWKGISTDEIQRVKPIQTPWQEAEHPLIDVIQMNRSNCIAYVEREGLGTPAKSSCIGCPYHDDTTWREMKLNDPESFADAVAIDKKIRVMPKLKGQTFLHRSCKPLGEVNFNEDQMDIWDMFDNECEGMCGV
ncbi:phosphoadenosine phosphosulfate reductase domain-containing protein [Viridibacillus arvi]|uniref:phosphoadenosine phosphosulfate reductase domain-containing protein n=1 Tax=Viridibacillus arvi TaxID=263475 RepID=UPI0034CDCE7A